MLVISAQKGCQSIRGMSSESTGLTNDKYTLFWVDEYMALTHRAEIAIEKVETEQVIFKERGKRKLKVVRIRPSMLFLKGWDLGLKIDTDFCSFSGNALLNFVGSPNELKEKIDQLNEYKQANKGVITYAENEHDTNTKYMLYPELADMGHAVVERMMSR